MRLTLGFSPCPNDTFIFDALVNKKIDTGGLEFDVRMEDVETLNELALHNTLDLTKISYGVLPLLKNYILLNSGSALGTGVGPLLISKKPIGINDIDNYEVAIPGEHTTAHMLFSSAFPGYKNKNFMRYDAIENYVLSNENAAGVIIHENRFTYQQRGLIKILDLGEFWQQKTGYPIPLGGIVGKKELGKTVLKKTDELIRKSIEYSYKHYPHLSDFVKNNAQEMDEDIMRKHIDLYVNNYSIDLGKEGKEAIVKMLHPGDIFLE